MEGMELVRKYAPGLRRMLTEEPVSGLLGGPNLWCAHTHRLKDDPEAYVKSFVKWSLLALLLGAIGGLLGAGFHHVLHFVTHVRGENPWLVWLLPAGGIATVALYRVLKLRSNRGTNDIIDAILSGGEVSETFFDLTSDDFSGLVAFAFFEGFANADDDFETGLESGFHTGIDSGVGFAEILTAFAVTDDNIFNTGTDQHIS